MSEIDIAELHTRAVALFGEQVVSIQDHEWDLPTPCAGWDVRDVVAHVVVGDSQVPPLFSGERLPRVAEVDPGVLGTNPVATWRGTALAAIAAIDGAPDLDARVHHPVGEVRVRTVVGFRTSDNLVHAWDIAVALTRPIELPDDIAEWCLGFWQPMAEGLPSSGYFEAARHPPDGASAGERLLSLLGRGV